MFHKPASEASVLNKSSCLAPALGVTKFIRFWSQFIVLFKSDLDVQQTGFRGGFVEHTYLKRITRCKLALIFTSADHRQFLGLFGSEAARL